MQNLTSAQQPNDRQVTLAQEAADGDRGARQKVNELAHPIISYQTDRFCKRFCAENKFLYRCTLTKPWGNAPADALLCEWGNASYAWMLNDLTNENRLRQFEGKHGARLRDYLYRIANSLPFYERWKDWRFGRRVHVPDYIREIDPHAAKVFFALRSGDSPALIAQNQNLPPEHADQVAQKIIITLTRRNKLHLLNPEKEQSLSQPATRGHEVDEDDGQERDIAVHDPDPAHIERGEQLYKAWQQLTPVEQFVIEAMVIEDQDANDVLAALQKLNIRIKDNVAPEATDRQQLYYFRRKTLAKLATLTGIDESQ
ncbi:MAG: hypothetical protein PVF34_10395 [Gammaproteobacteria bacterium]|jgi:hypothetical protein